MKNVGIADMRLRSAEKIGRGAECQIRNEKRRRGG
jgi:hypothetical protein